MCIAAPSLNKPKGLKVAKEDQKADRHDGH